MLEISTRKQFSTQCQSTQPSFDYDIRQCPTIGPCTKLKYTDLYYLSRGQTKIVYIKFTYKLFFDLFHLLICKSKCHFLFKWRTSLLSLYYGLSNYEWFKHVFVLKCLVCHITNGLDIIVKKWFLYWKERSIYQHTIFYCWKYDSFQFQILLKHSIALNETSWLVSVTETQTVKSCLISHIYVTQSVKKLFHCIKGR